jgi:DUF4097 and DUF4098 domain-containing protein YvlB
VTLELGVGDVKIDAGDRTDTVVEVRPSDPAEPADVSAAAQTRVEYEAGRLLVKAPKGWKQWTPRGGRESVDVHIQLPSGSSLTGDVGVSALRVQGRLADCHHRAGVGEVRLEEVAKLRVRTGAGDILVDRIAGDAEIKTGSGTVAVGCVGGPAVIKNANGETRVGEVVGDLRVQSSNGRIIVERAHATIVAKTSFGDIRLGAVSGGSAEANTACGQIDIGVLDGVTAWLDVHTQFGRVESELDALERPAPGEAVAEIKARTSFGDIVIRRAPAPASSRESA